MDFINSVSRKPINTSIAGYRAHILNFIQLTVAYVDKDFRFQYLNPAGEKFFGRDTDSLAGKSILEIFDTNIFEKIFLGSEGGESRFETQVDLPAGNYFVEVAFNPELDEKDKVIGYAMIINDITERKKAEENNAKLAAIVQSSDDAIISKSLESVVTSWNKSAERIFGYTAEEMIGESITKIIPSERSDEEPEIIERLKRGERVDHFETERVGKDGSRLNVSLTISPIKDSKGNIIGASKIARDITRQKKLLNALQESEERFRYVADTAPVMIWMTDTSKRFTFLNKGWLEFRGKKGNEGSSTFDTEYIHPEDVDRVLTTFEKSFDSRVPFETEYRIKKHNGEYRWLLTSGIPRYSPGNIFLGFIGSSVDIHEQMASREELEKLISERTSALNKANVNLQKSNEELERFAYVASHDLQEPLRKIQAFGNLLLERNEEGLNNHGKNYVNRMINAANRMQNLIEALLEFSRATTFIQKSFEQRNVNHIIDEVKKEFQEIIEEKNAVVKVAAIPPLTIIPFQFKQMISNIISNALKYSKKGEQPVISITSENVNRENITEFSAKRETDYCKITIKDNGIGFENEHAERIFELFQRLHGRHEYAGSGIGLAICKKIAENHAGFISAEGELGKGAAFHIFIPLK